MQESKIEINDERIYRSNIHLIDYYRRRIEFIRSEIEIVTRIQIRRNHRVSPARTLSMLFRLQCSPAFILLLPIMIDLL